jgi:4-amino-4-deoxy-L-arabinose transferase-like glycosyltransferase
VRPWSTAELLQVLHGSWDPSGIESSFYRPLTVYLYALRFGVFGLNGVAQHAISLIGMAICAVLAGVFVERETESRRAGLIAAGLYAIHPGFVAFAGG